MTRTRSARLATLAALTTLFCLITFMAPTGSPARATAVSAVAETTHDAPSAGSTAILVVVDASDAQRTAAAAAQPSKAGSPRAYHAGIPVATYSLANTAWGNLITTIPITGWSGRGPAMGFALYHNSSDGAWRTSYSALIKVNGPTIRYVVTDDGMEIKYTLSGGQWVPEQGFHSTLVDDGVGGYLWTLKDQTIYAFSSAGKLVSITDAAGNVLTVNRDPANNYRITSVVDASGRALNFTYNPATGRLASVSESFTLDGLAGPRTWILGYDAQNRLASVSFPTLPPAPAPMITINQYSANRILSMADKNGDAFTYAYDSQGRIQTVSDPAPYTNQTQQFSYPTNTSFAFQTNYTDRRGGLWKYSYIFTSTTPRRLTRVSDPFAKYQTFIYDSAYNVIRRYNELGKLWQMTYDGKGNLLTVEEPSEMLPVVSYTWDGYNNLTSVTDGESNLTEFRYEFPLDPTAPTTIVLPPAENPAEPETESSVFVDYWGMISDCCSEHPTPGCDNAYCESLVCTADEFCCTGWWDDVCAAGANEACDADACSEDHTTASGEPKTFTDANGVQTRFLYDGHGQLEYEIEGAVSESMSFWKVFTETQYDLAGRLTGASRYGKLTQRGSQSFHGGDFADARRFAFGGGHCGTTYIYGAGRYPTGTQWDCVAPASAVGGQVSCPSFSSLFSPAGSTLEYDAMEQWTNLETVVGDPTTGENSPVQLGMTYDPLGRPTAELLSTAEPTWGTAAVGQSLDRDFVYTRNDAIGVETRVGPDGGTTTVQSDLAGRVTSMQRETPLGLTTASYKYYDDGNVKDVTYGNNTKVVYTYYDNQLLASITHTTDLGPPSVFLSLVYAYDDRGLITQIAESGQSGTATVTFTYDSRGRLLTEQRVGSHPYDLAYGYDQGGNRLTKTDLTYNLETVYHYDLENPAGYQHENNRLMYHEVFEITNPRTAIERVDYDYALGDEPWVGNVTQIKRKVGVAAPYSVYATCLSYNNDAQLHVLTERTWQEDELGNVSNENIVNITDFRAFGRARYLTRQRDPNNPMQVLPGTSIWHDYDGDEIYGDYVVEAVGSVAVVSETAAFQPDVAQADLVTGALSYVHTDHIGSTRFFSSTLGTQDSALVHTAFGELVHEDGAVGTRYGYLGVWGYEALLALESQNDLLHVGYRTYEPATGRFLQRDPTTLRGGPNLYEYVRSAPTAWIDPLGLSFGCAQERREQFQPVEPAPRERGPKANLEVGTGGITVVFEDIGAWWPVLKTIAIDTILSLVQTYPSHVPGHPAPGFCFVAGTIVWTENGLVPIEAICIGDQVTTTESPDACAHAPSKRPVARLVRGTAQTLVKIELGREHLICTPRHRFMVLGGTWTRAEQLRAGDSLVTAEGGAERVISVEGIEANQSVDVYNLEVQGLTWYYVGASGVLVHNGKM